MKISEKQIVKAQIINRPLSKIWWQWTTSEGLKTFFAEDNKMELRILGPFEIYFLTENSYGLKGSEGCKIISYVPERQLVFTWNAPPQYPDIRNSDYQTWVLVDFEECSANETKVTITHAGWPEDDNWQPVFDYFDKAWQIVLTSLVNSL